MSFFSRQLDRFCYKHPGFGIPNLMIYVIIANAAVYILDLVSNSTFSYLLAFVPGLILKGQVWRIVTFVLVPESSSNILFFAITLYFYYFIGSALENRWGTTKFTVFFLCGVVLNLIAGSLIALIMPALAYSDYLSMYYVFMSMFFALASLYPDTQFLLFFIIPIKAKWLAWADAAYFVYVMVRFVMAGYWPMALLPAVAFVNYLLFFGGDIANMFGFERKRGHSAKTIDFNRAKQKYTAGPGKGKTDSGKPYFHKCAVCGKTDADYPDLEFRYCSRCKGYFCYCGEHINNHVHIQ